MTVRLSIEMGRTTLRIGDIVELVTPNGRAYAQYTHETSNCGELVRVLPGLYISRPSDFTQLAKQKELYFIFYALKYALRANQAEVVSNQSVPNWATTAPPMRHAAGRNPGGNVCGWRIVPALAELTPRFLQQTPLLKQLTPEQKKISIHVLRPHLAMVKELARGWTPERAEELEQEDRTQTIARKNAGQPKTAMAADQAMRHYLYFPEESSAQKADQWFRSQGFSTETKLSGDGENWLTLVKHVAPANAEEMDKLREEMEALASQLDGEYDGWELAAADPT